MIRKAFIGVATMVAALFLFASPASAQPEPLFSFQFPQNSTIGGGFSFTPMATPPARIQLSIHPNVPGGNQIPPMAFQIPQNNFVQGNFTFFLGGPP